MNFLIVVPRVVSKIGDFYQFPQGIAYISSVLVEAGFQVYKVNLNHIDLPVEEALRHEMVTHDIDVVLTGGLTGQFGAIRAVVEGAKRINDDIINVVGGGIITSAPLHAMNALEFADYGVIGEGEIIVRDLCRYLKSDRDVKEIPGIIYKDSSDYTITAGKPLPVDVNKVPFPDYKGLGLDDLLKTAPNIVGMSEINTFPIITSRGCPFRCTFCFHPSGVKYRPRSLESVFAEIDYLIGEYDIKYLSVQDELFGHSIERVKEFCERIKPYQIKWWAQFRVTDITPELVDMLKDANCATIGLGIESADDRILKSMNKKITVKKTNEALELIYNAGLGIQGCLIFGDVAETVETATNTLNWWKDHSYYGLQLSLVVTYPGTALFNYACENGLIEDPVQFIRDSCPTVKLSKMTPDEYAWMLEQILALQRTALSQPGIIKSIDIDYEQSCMNLTGICNSCNTENAWSSIRFFITESITCKSCGRRYYAPIPDEVVNRISENGEKLLKQYGKICFWGINSYFYSLCENLRISGNQNILYVDKSEIRHGINIFGGRVQSTEIIKDENIQCIIVTVPQYFTSLSPTIAAEFPNVDRIVSISELLSEEFSYEPTKS